MGFTKLRLDGAPSSRWHQAESTQEDIKRISDALYIFHEPTHANLDIHLFHGLEFEHVHDWGAHIDTWRSTAEKGEKEEIWPQKWLPEDFPHARIISVNYDRYFKQRDTGGGMDLYLIGEMLFCEIMLANEHCSDRPIILVGHGFGGVVLKELCVYAEARKNVSGKDVYTFLDSIRGFFFYDTPHRGLEGLESPTENEGPLLRWIRILNSQSVRLHQDFSKMWMARRHRWTIDGLGGVEFVLEGRRLRVPEASARFGDRYMTVPEDHFSVCRPYGKNDSRYQYLCSLIGDVLRQVERPEEHPSKRRDFSSKQSWTSPSSSKHSQTLRSDAVALGFTGFEDPFDPGRLLVIQIGSSQADLDANEEIVFLHDEGMALLFGVGLPFSKVVLRSNGEIAVYEVGETKWRQLWIWTDSEIGSVKVFDARATTEGVLQGADSVHAGEIRGRVSDSKQAFKRHPLQSSLSPFSSLWDAISFRLSERGSGGTTPDALLTQMNSSRGFSKAGGRSGVVATEVRIEQQPKREVTIEIYLDSFTCTENCTDYQLSDHRIEPVLVLTFFKEPRGGQILRRFRSALDFRFYMSGEQTVLDSDHEKFGWYHDRLQLSFKCLSGSDVRVDSQGVGSCRIMTGEPDTPGQNMEEGNATSAGGSEHKKAGFHVKSKDSPGEIGSLASIADKYNIWDMGERTSAFRDSGMMANALFTLTGNWTIWSEGLTNYVLLGTRDFILKMRGTKPPRSVGFSRQDSELRVSQEIRKVFKVDHSFTFFEELSDWQAWPMAVYAVAPHPISGMVDAVPESCPGNRVSGGAIVQSQTVPRTGEQTFSASDENQDSHEVAPTSEITTTLRANEVRDRETPSSESPTDVFTKDHLNGERVATKLNDYIYELSTTMEPDMEIVFCHGLNLDDSNNLHLSTWTSDDVGKLHVWPKTWLAEDFPHARVLTVSYDSSLYQTPELGRIGLHNTAENLMSNLLLEADPSSVHPLILVGYSFGGILIKQLCLHAYEKIASRYHRVQSEAFLERINAIYFMGTPHSGMIHEGFEVPRQENAGPLFKDVKLLNEELARLQQKFHNLRETYAWQISSVAESYMTRWGEFEGELVPEGSARYGSGELFATVPADHRSLSKASEKNCTVYKQLKALITQAYSKYKTCQLGRGLRFTQDEVITRMRDDLLEKLSGPALYS